MDGSVGWLFLCGAGFVAGIIGTAGGITSLVAYPALLAVGIPPLAANITNSVALLGSGFSSGLRAVPDLAGHSGTLRSWLPATALLSLVGAILLVVTPAEAFDRVVPLLVALGSLVLLFQPLITKWQERRGTRPHRAAIAVSGAGVALYNGYFGAGAGILLIALLLFATEPVLHRANALKNVILFVSDLLPAILFAVLGTVAWSAALPLGAGALVGGLVGPTVARRVPARILRPVIAAYGLVLAVSLV